MTDQMIDPSERLTPGLILRMIAVFIGSSAIAIIGLVLLVTVTVAGLTIYWEQTGTSKGDVESMIRENLHTGSSSDDVFRFLDSKHIEHGSIERAGSSCCALQDAGVPSDAPTIGAGVDGTRGLFGWSQIEIDFVLDRQHKLDRYIIHESFTGP